MTKKKEFSISKIDFNALKKDLNIDSVDLRQLLDKDFQQGPSLIFELHKLRKEHNYLCKLAVEKLNEDKESNDHLKLEKLSIMTDGFSCCPDFYQKIQDRISNLNNFNDVNNIPDVPTNLSNL